MVSSCKRNLNLLFFLLAFFLLGQNLCFAKDSLHKGWDELLQQNVHEGLVDYHGLNRQRDKLDAYLNIISSTSVESLTSQEQLALYINAYNSCTVSLILDNIENGTLPESIKDIGSIFSSPWSKAICNVGGRDLSLDEIEHGIIRPQFKDNRIHFAVNCASMSCPVLLDRAYFPSMLDAQLDQAVRTFLSDDKANYMEDNTLYVSRIFKWYDEDFPEGVVEFFLQYLPEKIVGRVSSTIDIKVKYLSYDWSLNKLDQ